MTEDSGLGWNTARVLDHGFVHLVDSMPHWGNASWGPLGPGDRRVAQAARVSMGHLPNFMLDELGLEVPDGDDRTPEQDVKLINYLMKNAHTSPFEKVRFEFVQKLPIFIARQQIRHRTGSFNEISARYAKLPAEFYVPELDRMQAQSDSNKQASGEVLEAALAESCRKVLRDQARGAYFAYEELLRSGLARELARTVLPLSIYTQWYWTVDLKNFLDFARLRTHPHAQYEIRAYAEPMLEMVRRVAPVSVAAWEQHHR